MGPLPRPGRKEGRGCSGQPWKRQTQLTPLSWPSTWKPWKRQKQGARRGWQMLLPRNWNSSPPLMSPGQGAPSTGARVASQGRLCSPLLLLLQALLLAWKSQQPPWKRKAKKEEQACPGLGKVQAQGFGKVPGQHHPWQCHQGLGKACGGG